MNNDNLKLLYFYSPSCGSCKAYEDVVDKLSTAFKIDCEKQNIDNVRPRHKIEGVPCIILENNGVEIYRSLGNVKFQQVYKDRKDFV